jgi:hypothetical protein
MLNFAYNMKKQEVI